MFQLMRSGAVQVDLKALEGINPIKHEKWRFARSEKKQSDRTRGITFFWKKKKKKIFKNLNKLKKNIIWHD